ncbi:MAG: hypothetical protein PHC34_07385 [Candidatus Gastranaerophilales bacterium]|nr:hypothetical protein [Candidatus Gastranaerophilales bacterium]
MNFFKKDNKELEEKFNAGFLKNDSKEIKPEKKESEEKKPDLEEMLTERQQIKKRIEKSLKELLFSKEEIKETLNIIDETYEQIQSLKDMLIGTNINNDPEEITKKTMAMITGLTEQMNIDLKKKVREIMSRRVI